MSAEGPKCYSTRTPKAAKEHVCCECRGTIAKGESYEYFSGVWDEPAVYKTCADCAALRVEVLEQCRFKEDLISFGGLYEHVFESWHADWVRRFMDTRRKRNAPESPKGWMERREIKILAGGDAA